MPAIQPARLRQLSAELVNAFGSPPAFVRELHGLLDFYADRTRRPGQAGAPPPLIHTYRTPAPVIRQVIQDLTPLVADDPQNALVLADALWEEENLECRLLGIEILGMIPFIRPIKGRLTRSCLKGKMLKITARTAKIQSTVGGA